MKAIQSIALTMLLLAWAAPGLAQDDGESTFTVNGYVKLQSGVFVPLLSDMFSARDNKAEIRNTDGNPTGDPCDPVMTPQKPCYPTSHGTKPGSLSMFRATAQLEADWAVHESVNLHAIVRAARSLETDQDGWAQMPVPSSNPDPGERREEIRSWVARNYYREFDLREFYIDAYPTDWLSFRIGRQQVTWGETGQFRLLDVINPIDGTWHFSPLESFEDVRIPLWIVKGLWEFQDIDHSLEVVWVPGIDRPRDMVTVPLTFVGAWGIPYANTPSPYLIDEKVFMYPDNDIEDTMRIGFRWKGNIGPTMTYSLVYYYTHQLSPPIPMYYDRVQNPDGSYSSTHLEKLYLGYPRQHIVGGSLNFTLENPIGAVVRLELGVEPDRMFPRTSTTGQTRQDPDIPRRVHFLQPRHPAMSAALVVMRPTMIRWLNPTQNFMLVFQLMYTGVFIDTETDKKDLVEIPGFNEYLVKEHSMKVVFATFTQYLHGLLTPKLIVAWILPDMMRYSGLDHIRASSAFISAELAVRLGDHWRLRLQLNDFIGGQKKVCNEPKCVNDIGPKDWVNNPYGGVGLFQDRDEINLSLLCQF